MNTTAIEFIGPYQVITYYYPLTSRSIAFLNGKPVKACESDKDKKNSLEKLKEKLKTI